MTSSISDTSKKRGRGRPSTGGQMPGVMVRMPPADFEVLDAYIAAQPDPKPSRPEAIRLALRDWLAGFGYLSHREDPEGAN